MADVWRHVCRYFGSDGCCLDCGWRKDDLSFGSRVTLEAIIRRPEICTNPDCLCGGKKL